MSDAYRADGCQHLHQSDINFNNALAPQVWVCDQCGYIDKEQDMSDAFHKDDPAGDPFVTQEWRDYSLRVVKEMLPEMKASAAVVSIAVGKEEADVQLACQIGFCLLLGKPLIIMADRLTELPPGLLRAADEVVYGEVQHPKTRSKLMDAMERVAPGITKEDE